MSCTLTIDGSKLSESKQPEPIRVLITGGTGYLGSHLLYNLLTDTITQHTPLQLTYTYHQSQSLQIDTSLDPVAAVQLDITSYDNVNALIDFIKPHVVIHTAALSDTVDCEKNKSITNKINVDGTKNIISSIINLSINTNQQHECALVHISSDWVYDGTESQYNEHMQANGFGVYGKSKLAAENIIVELCTKYNYTQYVILRSALIYGCRSPLNHNKNGVLHSIIDAIQHKTEMKLYSNEYRSPIYIDDIVQIIRFFINDFTSSDTPLSPRSPPNHIVTHTSASNHIYNAGGNTSLSRYEMGKILAQYLLPPCETSQLRSITLEQANQIKHRPKDLTMNSSKLRELTTYKTISYSDGVIDMIKQMSNQFAIEAQRTPLPITKRTPSV